MTNLGIGGEVETTTLFGKLHAKGWSRTASVTCVRIA